MSLSSTLTYSWRVVSAAAPARMIGVNHDVCARNATGDIVLDQIQALVYATAAASQGTLEVAGSTETVPWIPAGSYPISVNTFFPIWARGTFGLPAPQVSGRARSTRGPRPTVVGR